MKVNLDYLFKIGLFIGLILLITSLFFEWYNFRIVDENQTIIASWKFNIFFEWYSSIPNSVETNELYKPSALSFPWLVNIILIVVIIMSGYISISDNFENNKVTEKTRHHSEIYIVLLSLNFFYYWCFPVVFLFPNELLFPYLKYEDFSTGYTYFYAIGPGYICNIVAFILIFPYAFFFIYTTSQYKKESTLTSQENIHRSKDFNPPLNLDQLIILEQEKYDSTFKKSEKTR
ncbi:MAG: hypothetical protein ACFFDH_05440 [Promethearchaeota archaeon]